MKLAEIKKNGTYVGVRASKQTTEELREYCKQNSIDMVGTVHDRRLHVTIIYSLKKIPKLHAIDDEYLATPSKLSMFKSDDDANVLVLELDCPELILRHEQLKQLGGTHTFSSYKPHVTLSYDFDGSIKGLPNYNKQLILDKEYIKDLK